MVNSELEIEAAVRTEWQAVLDVPSASPDDDFFDLGGNSLLAVTFIERLEERFGIELPLEQFFLSGKFGMVVDNTRAAVAGLGAGSQQVNLDMR